MGPTYLWIDVPNKSPCTARRFLLEKSLIFGYSEAHTMCDIGVSSNGRTTVSGTVYLGSSPGAPALLDC